MRAETHLTAADRYRISTLPMTPPAILQIVNHKRTKEVDLSSVVMTGSGAAHLPPKIAIAFKTLLKNVQVAEGEPTLPSCHFRTVVDLLFCILQDTACRNAWV